MQKRYTGSDTRTNKYCVFAWPCWCCWCCCSSLCFLSGRQASDSSSLSLSLSLSVSAFGFQFSVFSWRTSAAFPIHFLSQEKGESVERERERERRGRSSLVLVSAQCLLSFCHPRFGCVCVCARESALDSVMLFHRNQAAALASRWTVEESALSDPLQVCISMSRKTLSKSRQEEEKNSGSG